MITLTAAHLARILNAAGRFADGDDDFAPATPILGAVHLHTAGDRLAASATNLYVAAQAQAPATGQAANPIAIRATDATTVARLAASAAQDDSRALAELNTNDGAPATLTARINGVAITVPQVPIPAKSNPMVGVAMVAELDPDPAEGHPTVALNPEFVALIAGAAELADTTEPVRWQFSGVHKPARAWVGDWFAALLMPVRFAAEVTAMPIEYPRDVAVPAA